jgi:UDP-N-acetyl-2-amino-2-deoxyglucuronate dehydrogenase
MAAIARNKHVLLEKPMGRSLEECERMIACARSRQVRFMLAHEKRFNPAAKKIRDIIESGEIGTVFHLTVHWGAAVKLAPDVLIPPGYGDGYRWRWTDPNVGGGILQDHLPHYVDLWRWWTGSEVHTVCTEAQHVSREYLGQPELGLWEDYGSVLMRFRNGAVGTFHTGTVGRALSPILHIGSGIGEWSEFGYLFGTRGQIAFDFPPWDSPEHGRVMVWSLDQRSPSDRGWYQVEFPDPRRCPGGPLSPVTNENHMFFRQMDSFIRCVREGSEEPVTVRDGRATLAVVEAAYESHRTGQKVEVHA